MRTRIVTMLVALFVLAGVTLTQTAAAVRLPTAARDRGAMRPVRSSGKYVESRGASRSAFRFAKRQVLVRFRANAPHAAVSRTISGLSARTERLQGGSGVTLLRLPAGRTVRSALRLLAVSPAVERAEPNFLYYPNTIPDDPFFDEQWGWVNSGQAHSIADPQPETAAGTADADADVDEAWDSTVGSSDVVVAVIDTGADLDHPDLVNQLWSNPGEIADGIDNDGNGYIDDLNGWDFVDDDDTPQGEHWHGTHVAGIIAAEADNGEGIAGVCPQCSLMILRAGNEDFENDAIVQAIGYATQNGADIINMSLGGGTWSVFQREAIEEAGAAGILSVISAGNEDRDNDLVWDDGERTPPSFPASYDLDTIVSVAASNHNDEYGYKTGCAIRHNGNRDKCRFTNYGAGSVDLAAPGVDVFSTYIDDYTTANGTSMASPFVAGVAGLIKSSHPSYSPAQLRGALLNSVDHPDSLSGNYTVTDGRVNAASALQAATSFPTAPSDGTIRGAIGITLARTGQLNYLAGDANDVFRKRLVRGRRYGVLLDVPKTGDFDLYVWKPGTLDIWQIDGGCGGFSCYLVDFSDDGLRGDVEFVSFKARATGVYYIQVSAPSGKGKYGLAIAEL